MTRVTKPAVDIARISDQRMTLLGQNVRRAREERELTQEELGKAVGLTRQSIANIEAGEQNILATSVPAFCMVLQITSDELLMTFRPPKTKAGADWRARAEKAERKLRAIGAVLRSTQDKEK